MATPSSSPQNTTKLRQLSLHPNTTMRHEHSQSQPDEGYAEDESHHSDGEMTTAAHMGMEISEAADVRSILDQILMLPIDKRHAIAQALVPTLPNPQKEELKLLIDRLTHFDPAIYLPTEIFLLTFSYLTPRELLTAGAVSRIWRARAQDERLWRSCFAREGWVMDLTQTEPLERLAERRGTKAVEVLIKSSERGKMEDEASPSALERRSSRKRGRDEAFSDGEGDRGLLGHVDEAISQFDGAVDELPHNVHVDSMEGVEAAPTTNSAARIRRSSSAIDANDALPEDVLSNPAALLLAPPVFQPMDSQQQKPKLSWPYLYKQRRRLEANWENGLYKMFQLPHPDHPEEGHDECVYTIQHTHRHLVSGSRDRTIRIWDLATNRLKRAPLVGHEASVLCLQFDERPEHDIIVSGGSDAYVIVWKFSTGEILHKALAHEESVLNLRFDDRYIVTCSKDKSIKIWTRHALARDSPLVPAHVVSDFATMHLINNQIPQYSQLSVLNGHMAAVNAVMIHDNTIVSASGDRSIKAWDIATGQAKKNYSGHLKGIACVQFDGRRIVSGSSDNTVRIFDAEQQTEIACLTGHTNLVRTVQARFGDLDIVSAEELAAEARKADLGFYAALAKGMQPAHVSRRHGGGRRNAGSSRPEHMLALGSKIPPGGGGSRWAKIVSGSYDETVIVWKKDSEGNWCPRVKLRQEILRPSNTNRRRTPAAAPAQAPQGQHNQAAVVPNHVQTQAHHHIATAQGHLLQANHLLQAQQQPAHPPQNQPALHLNNPAAAANAPNPAAQAAQHSVTTSTATTSQQQTAGVPNNTNATATAAGGQQQAQAPAAAAGHQGGHPAARESNRVFKLQFDARRIICCSQNRVIVGWDFANGDPELERVGEWSQETA